MIKLTQPISDAIHLLEADRPLLSQVLAIWNGLIQHAGSWARGKGAMGIKAEAAFKARFAKHYQPAMAAAMVVDPINFCTPGGDHARPDLDSLTDGQRADVEATILRLNPGATLAAVKAELDDLEFGAWSETMQRHAAQLLKRKEVEEDGRVKLVVATVAQRRGFWRRYSDRFPLLTAATERLLSVHATTCAAERNWSAWGRTYTNNRSRLGIKTAEKLIYVKANHDGGDEPDEIQHEEIALNYESS